MRTGSWVRFSYQNSNLLPKIESVDCLGSEESLSQCYIGEFANGSCRNPAQLYCVMEPEYGEDGELRFAENTTSQDENRIYGPLQVYMDGAWRSVCAEQFDLRDAKVACRQLGFFEQGKNAVKKIDGSNFSPN